MKKLKVVLYYCSLILPLIDIVKGVKRGIAKERLALAIERQNNVKRSLF